MRSVGGTSTHPMDGKGRVSFPTKHSKELHGDLVLVFSPDEEYPSLSIYESDEYDNWVDAYFDSKGGFDYQSAEDEYLMNEMYNNRVEITIDQAGRILIPLDMRNHAQIELNKPVVIAGTRKHVKIWNPEIYASYKQAFAGTKRLKRP